MPSACQPSKKPGSSSTQRRYFSTALSSSPMARSPFASSNSSSPADMKRTRGLGLRWDVCLLQSGRAPPLLQPLVEHHHPFALEIVLFESRFRLGKSRRIGWIARLEAHDQPAFLRRHEFTRVSRIEFADRTLDHRKIGHVRLFR